MSSGSDFSLECDCLPKTPRKASVTYPVSFNVSFIVLSAFALGQGCVMVCMESEGVGSLPACSSQGSNAGCPAWRKAPLPLEPFLQLLICSHGCETQNSRLPVVRPDSSLVT